MAIQQGSVTLPLDFKVPNVFFILELKFKLISLAQLCRVLKCFVTLLMIYAFYRTVLQ